MSLARSYATVGTATLASRLSGFVRDVMIAAVLGSSAVADAYIAAFLLPNLFRRVLSEGAFNAAFVPIYARRRAERGEGSVRVFTESAFSCLVGLVVAALILVEIAMPSIIAGIAPGFVGHPGKFADAVAFARIAFVFVGAIVVTAFLASVLNAVGRYALVAFAPLILNAVLIAVLAALLVLGWRETRPAGLALVVAVLGAGLVQLLVVWRGQRRAGLGLGLRRPVVDRDVRNLMVLILPGLLVAGAGHFNMVVAAQMSSSLPAAVSWLYYADRIFQLPLGFVAAAIGTVLLPEVARALSVDDAPAARDAGNRALEFGMMLVLPAALALALLAEPIVDVIYRRGAFTAQDSRATAEVLRAIALGLPGFVLVKVLLPPYLAREKMRIPMAASLAGIAANIAVTAALLPRWGHVAAPLGVAVSAWVNALVLYAGLAAYGGFAPDARARARLPRIGLAAAGATLAAGVLLHALAAPLDPASSFALRAAALAAICLAGVAAHAGLLAALGAADIRALLRALRGERGS